ncbi:MAG: PAS domain-containing protein [Epsilonproteobacteria bacterium]|nr:PAS domain-containing protein [Campylobacterota bacterium]
MNANSNEIVLDTKAFLVSETDEKGVITFANDDFCKASGFGIDELIGKPHSIVRHPDMPRAAFKDLWDTIKSGNKWRGFVKNKAKDGRYYWVYATVFPFRTCEGKQGYISCRRTISDMEKEKYEALYKKMREEER